MSIAYYILTEYEQTALRSIQDKQHKIDEVTTIILTNQSKGIDLDDNKTSSMGDTQS